MKSIQYILGTIFLGSFLTITSCNDKEDTEAPVITILSPSNHQTFSVGDTINIHFEIKENDELHHIDADLLDEANNQLWHRHWHRHSQFFEWKDQYIIQLSDAGQTLKVWVKADDHNGNEAEEMIALLVE